MNELVDCVPAPDMLASTAEQITSIYNAWAGETTPIEDGVIRPILGLALIRR